MRPALATDPRCVRGSGAEPRTRAGSRIRTSPPSTYFGETADGLLLPRHGVRRVAPLAGSLAASARSSPAAPPRWPLQIAAYGLSAAPELGIVHREPDAGQRPGSCGRGWQPTRQSRRFGIAQGERRRAHGYDPHRLVSDDGLHVARIRFGRQARGRTELYSLGCMLFEMLPASVVQRVSRAKSFCTVG